MPVGNEYIPEAHQLVSALRQYVAALVNSEIPAQEKVHETKPIQPTTLLSGIDVSETIEDADGTPESSSQNQGLKWFSTSSFIQYKYLNSHGRHAIPSQIPTSQVGIGRDTPVHL